MMKQRVREEVQEEEGEWGERDRKKINVGRTQNKDKKGNQGREERRGNKEVRDKEENGWMNNKKLVDNLKLTAKRIHVN